MRPQVLAAALLCALHSAMVSHAAMAQDGPGEATPIVIGNEYTIPSTVFGTSRKVSVRLPAEYAENPEQRFPVIYVIDGGSAQDFPHIAGIAQSREMNYSFEPAIIVGIETVNRRSEISPPVRAEMLAEYAEQLRATPGNSAQFRTFIAQDVKPWVQRNFRATGHAAIMGESLAGLFIIETLFEQPDLFDDWIAISPSLWWDDMKLARSIPDRLKTMKPGPERIYFALADEGYRMEEGVERLADALRADAPDGWQWAYVPFGNRETHGTIYHPAALDAWRLMYGTPSRVYKPYGDLASHAFALDDGDKAKLASECTMQNSRRTTPEATRQGQERLFYDCLLYDLGPRAREGNWDAAKAAGN